MNTPTIDINKATKTLESFEKTTFSWSFKHVSYKKKMDSSLEELIATNPKEIIKFWFPLWDKILWWIYWWKIYAIWGESWVGKSTFVNNLSNSLSKQWVKVTKYSLEDRMQDIWKEDLFVYTNRIRYKYWLELWNFVDFMNNEYFHTEWKYYDPTNINYLQKWKEILEEHNKNITELDKTRQVNISDLVKLMEEEANKWTKVFIIDHLHYFKKSWDVRTDLEIENIMHDINEVARTFNVAIFILAHYRKLNNSEPTNDAFKDASAIKQVANIIIHIVRDWSLTKFVLWKIRWKIKCKWFIWNYDIKTDSYIGFSLIEE
jgi:archaellum biogenesis ATPase FlaH